MFGGVADQAGPGVSHAGGSSGYAASAESDVVSAGDGETIPVRPLSWRELADLPFAVLQHRIRLVGGLAGAGFVVALGIVLAVSGAVSLVTDGSSAGNAWAAVISTLCCAWLLRLWIIGVTVPIGLAVVQRGSITARAAGQRMIGVFGGLLRHQVLSTLMGVGILVLGTPLLVTLIPAAIWLGQVRGGRYAVVPVLHAEAAPYPVAVARSKSLATGRAMPLAGLWIYLRGVLLACVVPVAGLLGYLSDISGTHRWAVVTLLATAALLITACAAAVDAATAVIVYLDRRCSREGFDIRIPTPSPIAQAAR